jgi:hypothetical protein
VIVLLFVRFELYNSQMLLLLVVLAVAFGSHDGMCTSWHNCLQCRNDTIEVDLLAFLSLEDQASALAYFENVRDAVKLARTMGRLHSDDLFYLHTTVAYLCCYRAEEYEQVIVPALRSVPWSPFNVSFARVVCNYDNATNWGSVSSSCFFSAVCS